MNGTNGTHADAIAVEAAAYTAARNAAAAATSQQWPGLAPADFAQLLASSIETACDPLHRRIGALERDREKSVKRIDALETVTRQKDQQIAALEKALAAGMRFKGAFTSATDYLPGDTIVRKGKAWTAISATRADPANGPTFPASWALLFPGGHDGSER